MMMFHIVNSLFFREKRVKFTLSTIILTLAFCSSITTRIVGTAGKYRLSHDEGITYLCATGHQRQYHHIVQNKMPPYLTWTPTSEWKKLWNIDKYFCFTQIATDLAHHDIHPPLYFWLLHIWSLIFGIHLWTGPLLNLLLDMIVIVALYKFANFIFTNNLLSSTAVLVWGLSPSVIETSFYARQYSLLTLWTVLFAWQILKFTNKSNDSLFRDTILLIVITGLGALTHYHFILLVAGCLLWLIFKRLVTASMRVANVIASIIAGYLSLLVFHPTFYLSVCRHIANLKQLKEIEIRERFTRTLFAFGPYRFYDSIAKHLTNANLSQFVWMLFLLTLILLCIWSIKRRDCLIYHIKHFTEKQAYILFLFFWITGILIVLYLSFQSPKHAMCGQYMSMSWPFVSLISAFILCGLRKDKNRIIVLFAFGWVLLGFSFIIAEIYFSKIHKNPKVFDLVKTAPMIIIDNTARGVLPHIMWHIPDQTPVLAAQQKDLIGKKWLWADRLKSRSLYLSRIAYSSTKEGRKQILDILSVNYHIEPSAQRLFEGFDRLFFGNAETFVIIGHNSG
jgi:hypothetical protein